jgi:hypothetical protein
MLNDAAISDWCVRSLGAPMSRALFRADHLAQVTNAELADGRGAVIKIRPHEPRIAGLWVRPFNAKRDAASGGGPQLDPLAGQIAERLARAGLPATR